MWLIFSVNSLGKWWVIRFVGDREFAMSHWTTVRSESIHAAAQYRYAEASRNDASLRTPHSDVRKQRWNFTVWGVKLGWLGGMVAYCCCLVHILCRHEDEQKLLWVLRKSQNRDRVRLVALSVPSYIPTYMSLDVIFVSRITYEIWKHWRLHAKDAWSIRGFPSTVRSESGKNLSRITKIRTHLRIASSSDVLIWPFLWTFHIWLEEHQICNCKLSRNRFA